MEELFRDYLLIKLRALLLDIIGVEIYYMSTEADLRSKESFDKGSHELLKESIFDCFYIDINLSNLVPLTLEKIADCIMNEVFSKNKENKNLVIDKDQLYWSFDIYDRLIETNSGPVGRICST